MPQTVASTREELRRTGRVWIARTRAGAVAAFLVIAVAAAYGARKPQWTPLVPWLAAYLAVALALVPLAARDGTAGALTAWAFPVLDVPVLYLVQRTALAVAPSPGYVVGWSIGLWLFTIIVATLTLRRAVLWATAVAGALCQTALVVQAGLGGDLVVTSVTTIALSAAVTTAAAQLLLRTTARLLENDRARRDAEQKAELLRREQDAVRSWTELVVHDLKQPLTSAVTLIDVVAEDLERGGGDPRGDLALLQGELRRIGQMVSELVVLSRLEQGAVKPQVAPHDARTLLERVRGVHAAEARAREATLEVSADAVTQARFDESLVVRALENLLSNALRFARPGDRVCLGARSDGAECVFSVGNSGPGIPENERATLFQKRSTTGSDHTHAGFGLYFCRLVAEAHGGSAQLVDSSEWNVLFELRFPQPVPRR